MENTVNKLTIFVLVLFITIAVIHTFKPLIMRTICDPHYIVRRYYLYGKWAYTLDDGSMFYAPNELQVEDFICKKGL